MNRYLILVKHSLPEIVENVPAREWHLSAEGRSRAKRLAGRLVPYQPHLLISSTEPKARETAEIIAEDLPLEVRMFDGLHEHDRSKAPYYSGEEFQNMVREFFARPGDLVFGNETANAAHSRFSEAVHSILDTYSDQNITIVSHGTVISLFVSRLTGILDYSLWTRLGLPAFVVLDMKSNTLIAQENIL